MTLAAVLTYAGLILAGLCIATVAAVIAQATRPLWDGDMGDEQ